MGYRYPTYGCPPYPGPCYTSNTGAIYALFIVLFILLLLFGFWWYFSCLSSQFY